MRLPRIWEMQALQGRIMSVISIISTRAIPGITLVVEAARDDLVEELTAADQLKHQEINARLFVEAKELDWTGR